MYTISKYNSYFWFLITVVSVTSVAVANGEIEVACEQALLFGQAKRASRERASEARLFRPNRRACSQAKIEESLSFTYTANGKPQIQVEKFSK